MGIDALKLACFSPTGTTRSIAQAIGRGMGIAATETVDLTAPEARNHPLSTSSHELLVVAVPVYVGRVPELLLPWLHGLRASGTPVVCVVVYGNRAYEDALCELKDILESRGCLPIACAAYIGEHAFSSAEAPIAAGRPDADDVAHAEQFGRALRERLPALSPGDRLSGMVPDIKVPGQVPQTPADPLFSVDFISVGPECAECGTCAAQCPVAAVDMAMGPLPDKNVCVLCCACIKHCPENARTMAEGQVKDIALRLSEGCAGRHEPVLFFA